MTVDTRMATASGSKGFTAVVVHALAADGTLPLTTPARELLGQDLPLTTTGSPSSTCWLIAPASGTSSTRTTSAASTSTSSPCRCTPLVTTTDYLAVLDGHPQSFAPDERFAYNGGFVVLALLAERAAGIPFVDLVRERVTSPAGMGDTDYLRSDEHPARTALGYLDDAGPSTNFRR